MQYPGRFVPHAEEPTATDPFTEDPTGTDPEQSGLGEGDRDDWHQMPAE